MRLLEVFGFRVDWNVLIVHPSNVFDSGGTV